MDLIRIIFAILLPPVGVFLQVGIGDQPDLSGPGVVRESGLLVSFLQVVC